MKPIPLEYRYEILWNLMGQHFMKKRISRAAAFEYMDGWSDDCVDYIKRQCKNWFSLDRILVSAWCFEQSCKY